MCNYTSFIGRLQVTPDEKWFPFTSYLFGQTCEQKLTFDPQSYVACKQGEMSMVRFACFKKQNTQMFFFSVKYLHVTPTNAWYSLAYKLEIIERHFQTLTLKLTNNSYGWWQNLICVWHMLVTSTTKTHLTTPLNLNLQKILASCTRFAHLWTWGRTLKCLDPEESCPNIWRRSSSHPAQSPTHVNGSKKYKLLMNTKKNHTLFLLHLYSNAICSH